jgi:hypothetical protein
MKPKTKVLLGGVAGLLIASAFFGYMYFSKAEKFKPASDNSQGANSTTSSDTIAPAASLATSQSKLDQAKGKLSLAVDVSDNVAVTRVGYVVDGKEVGFSTSSPFGYSLDTTKISDGKHSLEIVAYDAAGNRGSSKKFTLVVANGTTSKVTTKSTSVSKQTGSTGSGSGDSTGDSSGSSSGSSGASSGCPSGQVGTSPKCYPAPPAPLASGKSWKVPYAVEFDGSSLDTTKLSPCFDWNYGGCTSSFNNGKETYKASQVQVSNGTAKLVAEPLSPAESDSACYSSSCTYKAGLISTARPRADNDSDYLYTFKYGYVESRMKFPGVAGFFTAFWMLPADPTYDYQYEIDIAEILGGHPDTIWMTNHYNGRTNSYEPNSGWSNNGACAVKNYSVDWIKLGLDWQSDHIAWYINGVKCGQFTGPDIANVPMQIILHMMIDNNWERSENSLLANQSLTNQLEVDYLRVYQQQ